MADHAPPDKHIGHRAKKGNRSGKVADFRYKRSSKPNAKTGAGKAKPPHAKSAGRGAGQPRKGAASDDSRERGRHGAAPARAKPPSSTFAPHNQSRPHPRQAYAALDLGTNNCRLLIARPRAPISP